MSNALQRNRLSDFLPGSLAEVDTLFNQFFPPARSPQSRAWEAPASLWEEEDHLHLEIDAPGVARENIDVSFDKGELSVTLERPSVEGREYWHNERGAGKVVRTVTLPETVDADSIEAELTNGVLRVSIAKLPEEQPRKIELK